MKPLSKILTIGGGIVLSSLLPMKKAKAQVIDGWFEASKGIKQGNNLRIYPRLNIKGVKAESLTDINNFYDLSKNDLSYEKLELKLGKHFILKPVLTYFIDSNGKRIMGGPNISYNHKKLGYGFFELSLDPSNLKESLFITYSGIPTKIGNFGMFTFTPINDIKSTYTELEYTAKDIKDCGVSPYGRVNLMKGVKPTYQVGLSANPRKIIKKFKRNKKWKL